MSGIQECSKACAKDAICRAFVLCNRTSDPQSRCKTTKNNCFLYSEQGINTVAPDINYGSSLRVEKLHTSQKPMTVASLQSYVNKLFCTLKVIFLCLAPWHVGEIIDNRYTYWESLFTTVVNEHLPTRKMRFREKDISYMTKEWKNAIRDKRRFSKLFAKNRELGTKTKMEKWGNKTPAKSNKKYWSEQLERLKSTPRTGVNKSQFLLCPLWMTQNITNPRFCLSHQI